MENETAEDSHEDSHIEDTEEDDETLESLAAAKDLLRSEWAQKRESFTKFWEEQTHEIREELIRAVNPLTPNSPKERFLLVNGKLTNVQMNCIMAPQLCISEIVPENKFIDLMDKRCAEDDVHWVYEDYAFIKSRIQQNHIAGNVDKMENQIAFLFPMDKFGAAVRLNVNATKGQEWFKKEIIVNASTFGYLFSYQSMMYNFLNGLLKEIATQIAKNKLKECSNCGKNYWAEDPTKGLKFCTCGKVSYCCKECQKNDWPNHKPNHAKS
eukprot:Phypoly_transcript_14621.p1 GENE.Phypoly_transcript_14621~~Phypoly_transcript_14621.p1  ORF type:complete len:268 (+),score=46.07 Phypoly_transcript_14621:144-947(+)